MKPTLKISLLVVVGAKVFIAAIVLACLVLTSAAHASIVTMGLIQDLNADVGVTGTSPVTAWANQGSLGAAGNVSSTGGIGSVTLLSGVAGTHNALRFVSGSLLGTDASSYDSLANGSGFTWFAVIDADPAVGSPNSIWGTLTDGGLPYSGTTGGSVYGNRGMIRYRSSVGTDTVVQGITDLSAGGYNILVGRLAAGTGNQTAEIFVDSATADSLPAVIDIDGATDSEVLVVGYERPSGGEGFEGDLARLLIYNRPLSDAELTDTGLALGTLYDINFVPEPTSLALAVMGLIGFVTFSRRRKR